MLRTIENLNGYRLVAQDGEMGKVWDFFLDDERWRLRYLVVETGTWLNRRRVLLDPRVLGTIDAERREVMILLTRDEVTRSPDVDTNRPVFRQQEILMAAHYGRPADAHQRSDLHLRSIREISSSYWVRAGRAEVGHVHDFVVDDRDWSVRQIVIASGGWLDSRLLALPVESIENITWAQRTVWVHSSVKPDELAVFEHGELVNRFESVVYFDYFGRPVERGPMA